MVELFHVIADPGSAQARKYVVEQGLTEKVRFRNLVYDEVKADFSQRGGTTPPGLWDGERLYQGAEAVLRQLASLR